MKLLTEVLQKKHRRTDFKCGKELLDNYLQTQASQDVKRKLSACFVLENVEAGIIQGYYTLSSSSISLSLLPDEAQKKLPKSYTAIPTILLGRLAIDQRYQGNGIGKLLLIDTLKRCNDLSETIGSYAVIVDPLDADAEKFYEKYGFIKLPDSGKMFLSMSTIKMLFE